MVPPRTTGRPPGEQVESGLFCRLGTKEEGSKKALDLLWRDLEDHVGEDQMIIRWCKLFKRDS